MAESPPTLPLRSGSQKRTGEERSKGRVGDNTSSKIESVKVIKVADDLYSVCATPPDVLEEWSPPEPIRGRRLTRELIDRGAHQTDAGDAMNEAYIRQTGQHSRLGSQF